MEINNPYLQDVRRCLCPIYKTGDACSFYINFDEPISDPDFEFFSLAVYDGDTRVSDPIPGLQQYFMAGSTILYNIFAEFTFPIVPMGYYTFCIYNNETEVIMCRSNLIVANRDDYYAASSLLQYRASFGLYNFYYDTLPAFYNMFRLLLIHTETQYEIDRTQYRNVSDRKFRNLKEYRDKVVKIESHYFDLDAHEAITAAHEHDTFYLNTAQLVAKSGYNINNKPNSVLNKADIDMYVQDDNAINIDFNTWLYFDSVTSQTKFNVTGNVDNLTKMYFGFNRIEPCEGLPANMDIYVNGINVFVVTFLNDYLGKPFKLYNYLGFDFEGVFTNDVVDFTI